MKQIRIEQIKLIHQSLITETGGSSGVRDMGLLESAMFTPFQTFDGEALYPSVQQKASKLCTGLIQNHPFIDGNKRIGIHAMLIFLSINGIDISYTGAELIQIGLEIADGKMNDIALVKWIIQHEI